MRQQVDSVAELVGVVRRALAARTRDRCLIEDLTQDTLVRLAAVSHRLSPDERRAYAIVTARNLLTSHARHRAVHQRHVHRLVVIDPPEGPEQRTLHREETEALVEALARLDPGDRQLLLRHESDGTEIAKLAEAANVTPGAMATRLARARAHLRLEFLLAFRRANLPGDRCRAVLLSLSNGDRRRQAMLDAPAHLAACPTCADLAEPLMRRNRRVVALLLLPCTDGFRRAWGRLTGMLVQRAAVVTMAGAALSLPVAPGVPIAEPAQAMIRSEPSDTIPFSLTPTPGTPGVPMPTITVPSAPMSTVSFPPSTTATTAPPAPADAAPPPGTPTPCPLTTPVADLDAATDALCSSVTSVASAVEEPVIAAPAPMLASPPTIVSAVEETVGLLPASTLPPAPIIVNAVEETVGPLPATTLPPAPIIISAAQEPVAAAPARVLPRAPVIADPVEEPVGAVPVAATLPPAPAEPSGQPAPVDALLDTGP